MGGSAEECMHIEDMDDGFRFDNQREYFVIPPRPAQDEDEDVYAPPKLPIDPLIVTGPRGTTMASSICDLQCYFLRAAAHIFLYRFGPYDRLEDFREREYLLVPYKFCKLEEVQEYVDDSLTGIRDELRPLRVKEVSLSMVDEDEASIIEANVEFYQTTKFFNRRIKRLNNKVLKKMEKKLRQALLDLQRAPIDEITAARLDTCPKRFVIKYAHLEHNADDWDDKEPPQGWERYWPTEGDAPSLVPWTDAILNEFNQMQFNIQTSPYPNE